MTNASVTDRISWIQSRLRIESMNLAEAESIVSAGESEFVELKKSTGQLKRAAETLCGFLNGTGEKHCRSASVG